nr:SCAN domain-containing protein 3-like [Nothobranchius furzeri]
MRFTFASERLAVLCVKRHFETKHQKDFKDEEEKAESIARAVSRYEKQASTLKVFTATKHRGTEASFRIAHCIAKHGKPFTDGNFIKEAFLCTSDVLFDGLPNKDTIKARIQDIPASARTMERCIQEMGDNVRAQQTAGLKDAQVLSVALDESIDINDVPRLAVMVRYCDVTVQEELFCLTPMPETTRGEDIANVFMERFEERGIDIAKIFAVTTDGAPAMVGKHRGAVTLIEEQIGHPIMKLHCIIHQENLCAKMSNSDLNDVMATVAKTVNFIVKRSALTHRQFQSLLEEMESSCKDIPLHCAVRWLSCGKVLERFVDCFDVVKTFLDEKGQRYPELEDERELSAQCSISTTAIHECIRRLQTEFITRFQDFQLYGPMFSFLIRPESFGNQLDLSIFNFLDTDDMEMQLIELKSSTLWGTKFAELRQQLESTAVHDHGACIFSCWTSLPDRFNCLKNIAQALLTVFGSTYLCEQIFSHMKSVLSASRSCLTAGHSETCVLLKVTKCEPQITELANAKQGQKSH